MSENLEQTAKQGDEVFVSKLGNNGEKLKSSEQKSVEHASEDAHEPKENSGHDENEAAHYEVSVQKYAHYDKTEESDYDETTQNSLKYASRTPFARFIFDFMCILTRPGVFWKGQSEHPASLGQLHGPHLAVLVALRTISVIIGGILQSGTDVTQVVVQAVSQAILIFVSIWVLALIISGMMSLTGNGFHYERSLRFVGFAVTPMLFVSIISIIPVPNMAAICDLLAMPWAFIVMGAGMLPYLKIKNELAPTMTGLFCGLLVCAWSLMPTLLPMLLSLKQ